MEDILVGFADLAVERDTLVVAVDCYHMLEVASLVRLSGMKAFAEVRMGLEKEVVDEGWANWLDSAKVDADWGSALGVGAFGVRQEGRHESLACQSR